MAGFAGFYVYVLRHTEPPCTQPCQDVGNELDPVELARGFKKIRPKCGPIELSLELAEPRTRTGTWYTLWYRIGIKNVCCGSIPLIREDLRSESNPGYSFRIWGPDGKLVRRGKGKAPVAFGVLVYETDSPVVQEGEPYLLPGETAFTNSSILNPRSVATGEHGPEPTLEKEFPGGKFRELRESLQKMQEENFAKELKRIQPLNEGFPGYRVLRHYAFDKPGRYKIQAVYEGYAYIMPSDRWPHNLSFPLDVTADIIEDFINRRNQFPNYVQLRAESKILEFEVEPWGF
ncbi:MAG: hypothetical protein AUJ52_07790 [Elusimicrobia bacterium CG1_02_63_36]|nr:MAG: hypothetical protein AUJ52_07790 [Elusimicrobia bacterium CG1_02_63_36]PJA15357.1 MAG: hypothetical protein COX66_10570 [Elusimicrobia bacterium CG_4_10_14_0_2_um_filter_63_34]PJB26958.1 MAG: hypothetical protein CO113_00630 [Elusimicrobia bacterium CG_4_9_14_3_um_filter_62_55]